MPDLSIDYEMLHRMATEAEKLKSRAEEVNSDNPLDGHDDEECGPDSGVSSRLRELFSAWSSPFDNAKDGLDKLKETYKGTAEQWFRQDAEFASTAVEQAAGFRNQTWEQDHAAYESYQEQKHETVTTHYLDENGKWQTQTTPAIDPKDEDPKDIPKDPGARPTDYTVHAGDSDITSHVNYDDDGKVLDTKTSVSGGAEGDSLTYSQSSTEHYDGDEHTGSTSHTTDTDGSTSTTETTLNDDGGSTSHTENSDGSSSVSTVTVGSDGHATRKDESTDKDGKEDTTTSTTDSYDSGAPIWNEEDDDDD